MKMMPSCSMCCLMPCLLLVVHLQRPGSAFRRLVEETTKGGGLNAGAVADALAGAIEAANSSH